MYCLYLFCFGLKEFTLVCKRYFFKCSHIVYFRMYFQVPLLFYDFMELLDKSLFGIQRPNSETFWVLNAVDDCGWYKHGLGRKTMQEAG